MNDVIHTCEMFDLSEDSDVTMEFLTAAGFQFSSEIDKECHQTRHIIYSDSVEGIRLVAAQLERLIPEWRDYGVELSSPTFAELEKKDWSEEWKKHFDTIHASKRLVVNPSWLTYDPKPGEIVITLDPGMSFGTGRHETTLFCLRTLDRLATDMSNPPSFLDAGCGSGILSIAAYKLGYRPIHAFDVDPDAVAIAKENALINHLSSELVRFDTKDLAEAADSGMAYDVVAANILAHVLVENAEKLIALVKPGGWLILSGILAKEYETVAKHFSNLGCDETDNTVEGEWRSGLFMRHQ